MPHLPSWLILTHKQSRALASADDNIVRLPGGQAFTVSPGEFTPADDEPVIGIIGEARWKILDGLEYHQNEIERLTREMETIEKNAREEFERRDQQRSEHRGALAAWMAAEEKLPPAESEASDPTPDDHLSSPEGPTPADHAGAQEAAE